MGIQVVEADVKEDLNVFVDLLNRNRDHITDKSRFEWLYLKNPHGKARVWMVINEKDNQPVAFTCVLPRLMYVGGKKLFCWNCGDFSVDKKFRTLGVALKLRRKAKEGVDSGEIDALYAHPNERMAVIHEKVGHYRLGTMRRYVKLLRSEREISKRLGENTGKILGIPVNFALWLRDVTIKGKQKGYTFELLANEPYSEEYDYLAAELATLFKVVGDRSASYLNWRYYTNPIYETQRFIVRDDKILKGCIIFYIEKGVAVLKDIFCPIGTTGLAESLLGNWLSYLRRRKVYSVSAILMESNPVLKTLSRAGFVPRPEESAVFAYTQKNKDYSSSWLTCDDWFMTVGDRDV